MESKIVRQPSESRPVSVYLAEVPDKESEVSLSDLWETIVRRKWQVSVGFGLTLLLTVMYLFVTEPVYRATAYLLPPQQQNIQGLRISARESVSIDLDVESYTPKYVFDKFLDNLRSQRLRREFFDEHKLVNHYVSAEDRKDINENEVFESNFNDNIQVKADKDTPSLVSVSFTDTAPKLAAQWVNQFVDFVNRRTIQQMTNDVNVALQAEIKWIHDRLSSKLQLAKQRRIDKVTVLKEALRIAGDLGIEDVKLFPGMTGSKQSGLAVNTAAMPLYMRGTTALETEISVIESRKSDESFIDGYRDLQERITFMETVLIDPASLAAVTVDGPAHVPYRAEKPKRLQIAVLGVVLGIIVGIFLALAAESLFGARRKPSQ